MTLVVNLFGGPGVGKSTLRAGVFHKLKLKLLNVEEVIEFVKGSAKAYMQFLRKLVVITKPYHAIYFFMNYHIKNHHIMAEE